MTGHLLHLADRVLNQPLMLDTSKTLAILDVVAGRLGVETIGASRFAGADTLPGAPEGQRLTQLSSDGSTGATTSSARPKDVQKQTVAQVVKRETPSQLSHVTRTETVLTATFPADPRRREYEASPALQAVWKDFAAYAAFLDARRASLLAGGV